MLVGKLAGTGFLVLVRPILLGCLMLALSGLVVHNFDRHSILESLHRLLLHKTPHGCTKMDEFLSSRGLALPDIMTDLSTA